MTTPKLIDISHNIRCMGCGATDRPVIHVLGHSDVWARAWPLCASCLRMVADQLPAATGNYLDLPPEPADDDWIDERMTP